MSSEKIEVSKRFLLKPIVYILGLSAAAFLVLWIETVRPSDFGFYKDIFKKEIIIQKSDKYPLRKPSRLTEKEMEYARIAWIYFQKNYQPATGLINAVDNYASTTFWDIGSYFNGLVAAYEIGIIDSLEFDFRINKALESLSKIKLYKGILPNKVYHTQTLEMANYANEATMEGVGWSAMDIGRFYSFVNKIRNDHPQYIQAVKKVTDRWQIDKLIQEATMHGIGFSTKDRREGLVQEGKLGYEEYCAKGLYMVGYDVSEALKYTDFIKFVDIYGEDVAVDTREVRYSPAYNYVLSEPYILDGIEYGWDFNSRELAYRIYKAQKKRFEKEGILTAVSEDHIDQEPYFVYNSVYANGKEWNCISESGEPVPHLKSLSTKAAFGWYALYNDDYANKLFDAVKDLYDPKSGWYSGRYETNGEINRAVTANTNGIILECLAYKANGKLIAF